MKYYPLFFIAFGLVLLSGCKKDNAATSVEGYLVSGVTGHAIPYGNVCLQKSNSNCWSCGNGSTIATYKTDGSGHFSFQFTPDGSNYSYSVYGDAPNYKSNQGTSSGVLEIQKGKKNSGNITLNPFGWIMLHVKNITQYDSLDQINVTVNYNPGDISIVGKTVDTMILEKFGVECIPSCFDVITYTVSRNHTATAYTVTANTTPLDTVTTSINY